VNYSTATRFAILYALATVACAVILASVAGNALASPARAVSYSDRNTDPTMRAWVAPGQDVSIMGQCEDGGYYTDVAAYRANGAPLMGQRWTRDRTVTYWTMPRTRVHARVTFDGVTFHNGTSVRVMIAGWC
jgi:hypothetical protein